MSEGASPKDDKRFVRVVRHKGFALAGSQKYLEQRNQWSSSNKLSVRPSEGTSTSFEIVAEGIGAIGHLTSRSGVARELATGNDALQIDLLAYEGPNKSGRDITLSIVTGPPEAITYFVDGFSPLALEWGREELTLEMSEAAVCAHVARHKKEYAEALRWLRADKSA